MTAPPASLGDSPRETGGAIPGSDALPAFSLRAPRPSVLPVLVAVPHAGRSYPAALTARMRSPGPAALKLEDRYADTLGDAIARETGAALLVAHAPRAMIDLNRGPDEMDWDMVAQGRPPGQAGGLPSMRVRSGLGLIPRRIPGLGDVWKGRQDRADVAARLAQIHEPYHAALAATLAALRARWGAALLIDLHSMPPLGTAGGPPGPHFVVGDRFGASCHGSLVAEAFTFFARHGRTAAHNRPYAGGYVLDRHGDPAAGIHALQLEIDRSCYLDAALAEPGAGFAQTAALVGALVRHLAARVADLAQAAPPGGWPAVAE